MSILPLLLDHALALPDAGRRYTVLGVPLGRLTVLEHLHTRALRWTREPIRVLTTFEPDAEYERTLRGIGIPLEIAPAERLGELLDAHEPADRLLLLDPSCFALHSPRPDELRRDPSSDQLVRNWVPLLRAAAGLKEYVQVDPQGGVRRIQRFYDGVTRVETSGVAYSYLSVAAARAAAGMPFSSLAEFRCELASRGMPCHDRPLTGDVLDLRAESDLLAAAEHFVRLDLSAGHRDGMLSLAPGVLTAPDARVAHDARLIGPVVVHAGASIENRAVVIGPAVIGRDVNVGSDAIVAQCLVLSGTSVAPHATVRQRVVAAGPGEDWNGAAAPPGRFGRRALDAGPRLSLSAGEDDSGPQHRAYLPVKRTLDFIVALLGLLLLSPLLVVVALLIKLTSPGPMFYLDDREGRGGRTFRCRKFRTMTQGAHAQQRKLYATNEVDGPQFKIKDDPRITPLGYWLRRFNIDELPQLFNVLRGDMSLIGPRPSPFRENQICVPWRNARLSVPPGITGLWQICRSARSVSDFHQWIYYDTLYVRHLSFLLDLRILVATLLTFGGRFSVPLAWLVPVEKQHADAGLPAPIDPA
jgi:lipopolysaccharide/colanic/teichoic acid biosynthesis glycosyltransferase